MFDKLYAAALSLAGLTFGGYILLDEAVGIVEPETDLSYGDAHKSTGPCMFTVPRT